MQSYVAFTALGLNSRLNYEKYDKNRCDTDECFVIN